MGAQEIRQASRAWLTQVGLPSPIDLPLIDEAPLQHSTKEIADRACTLAAVVAAACGFPRSRAIAWLEEQRLLECISPHEESYLTGEGAFTQEMRARVESLYALAWALELVDRLDFTTAAPSALVTVFPDLKKMESTDALRRRARLRPDHQLREMLDLSYCLHWALTEVGASLGECRFHPVAVEERRRALEWLFADNPWDDVLLDT